MEFNDRDLRIVSQSLSGHMDMLCDIMCYRMTRNFDKGFGLSDKDIDRLVKYCRELADTVQLRNNIIVDFYSQRIPHREDNGKEIRK